MKSFLRPRRDIPYKSPSLYSAFYKLLIYSEFDTYSIAEHCQLPSAVLAIMHLIMHWDQSFMEFQLSRSKCGIKLFDLR